MAAPNRLVYPLLAVLLLAGCATSEPFLPVQPMPDSTGEVDSVAPVDPPEEPGDEVVSELRSLGVDAVLNDSRYLYGPEGARLSQFLAAFPGFFDGDLGRAAVVAEGDGVRELRVPLSDERPVGSQIVLAIFCESDSPYRIQVLIGDETVDETGGTNCFSPGITTYQTAPFSSVVNDAEILITADDGVPYRYSIMTVSETVSG